MAKRTQRPQQDPNNTVVVSNRRARYEYEVLDEYEAGIALLGSEIKAIRGGKANIAEAFGRVRDGDLWLYNVNIAPYLAARENHEATRPRRLLLHRKQIDEIEQTLREQPRTTIVPLRLYLQRGMAKVALGVVRGRRSYDKRQVIAEREAGRTMQLAIRRALRA